MHDRMRNAVDKKVTINRLLVGDFKVTLPLVVFCRNVVIILFDLGVGGMLIYKYNDHDHKMCVRLLLCCVLSHLKRVFEQALYTHFAWLRSARVRVKPPPMCSICSHLSLFASRRTRRGHLLRGGCCQGQMISSARKVVKMVLPLRRAT